MKTLFSISAFCLLVSSWANAQPEVSPCGINHALEEVYQINPETKAHMEAMQLLQNSHVPSSNGEAKSGGYVIPVVFHVMHEYGTENISDAQIYDAMEVINREYAADDPDSVNIIDAFENNNAFADIQFKLAAIDPFGNCTNGIEHIYTHETQNGDAFAKVNQWNRSKYLNIWVAKSTGGGSAAAYALYPTAVDGSNFWLDGIMSLHQYVGSIGTSNTTNENTLTHEIGHYLNLSHVWGNTNDPEVACGDDGVADTPVTMGYSPGNCPSDPLNSRICDPTIIEDYNNYMDYSYCNYHFTQGQVDRMYNALDGISGQRNLLWLDSNLNMTGVMNITLPQVPSNDITNVTVPLCAPIADFHSPDKTVCVGSFASFSDESWNAVIGDRAWTFEGGTPATSTSANVNVSWDTPGYKKVTLTVSNEAGSDTKEVQHYIYVAPEWPDFTGPTSFDMESNTNLFLVQNPEDNYGEFAVASTTGGQGNAFKLGTYFDNSESDPYTEDYFYTNRLGGSVDALITPSVDLRNTSSILVTFKYAYATNATLEADITEELKVYTTRNCGETWTTKNLSVDFVPAGTSLSGSEIVTAGFASNADFSPTSSTQWKTASFAYTSNTQDNNMRIKFEFTASDLASNLYIDDINIEGVLGLNDETLIDMELEVYPNPTNGEAINVSYMAQDEPTEFILRDVQGKIIATQTVNTTNAQVTTALNNTENLASSYYFLEVRTGESTMTKKVVVL